MLNLVGDAAELGPQLIAIFNVLPDAPGPEGVGFLIPDPSLWHTAPSTGDVFDLLTTLACRTPDDPSERDQVRQRRPDGVALIFRAQASDPREPGGRSAAGDDADLECQRPSRTRWAGAVGRRPSGPLPPGRRRRLAGVLVRDLHHRP
jgi:hypothetical protein